VTITYPRTLPCGVQTVEMVPDYVQAINQSRGRVTQVLERADPRWRFSATYAPMERAAFQALQAWLLTTEGSLVQVLVHDAMQPYPLLYPRAVLEALTRASGGAFDGTATVNALGPTTVQLGSLPAGFKLSAGDYVGLAEGGKYGLVKVVEDKTASGIGNVTLDVRPRFQTKFFTTAAQAHLVRPACLMTLDPGSVSAARTAGRRSPISFSGVQFLQ
jgi:hypothetical protein